MNVKLNDSILGNIVKVVSLTDYFNSIYYSNAGKKLLVGIKEVFDRLKLSTI